MPCLLQARPIIIILWTGSTGSTGLPVLWGLGWLHGLLLCPGGRVLSASLSRRKKVQFFVFFFVEERCHNVLWHLSLIGSINW